MNATVDSNAVVAGTGDGVRMVGTANSYQSASVTATVTDNTISSRTGAGIYAEHNYGPGAVSVTRARSPMRRLLYKPARPARASSRFLTICSFKRPLRRQQLRPITLERKIMRLIFSAPARLAPAQYCTSTLMAVL